MAENLSKTEIVNFLLVILVTAIITSIITAAVFVALLQQVADSTVENLVETAKTIKIDCGPEPGPEAIFIRLGDKEYYCTVGVG